jgi:pimeloyl-ACP methyl ester carboxylesterase
MKSDSYLYVEINGTRIAYQRQGKGEPMLLVHGTTTYSFIWDTLVPGLSLSFDVIAIDLLGGGRSDKPRQADYSTFAQAEMIHNFISALGLKTVHLVSHGAGGGIAQVMAARYPEQLEDLVFINPFGYDKWPVQSVNMMRVPFIWDIAVAMFDLGFFRMVIERGVYYKDRVTDEVMRLFCEPLKTRDGKYGFLRLAKSLISRDLSDLKEELCGLDMPALIIRGDADPYLSPKTSRTLHDTIKDSTLIEIKTGGHFIQLDEPDKLVGLIKDFIPGSRSSHGTKGGGQ